MVDQSPDRKPFATDELHRAHVSVDETPTIADRGDLQGSRPQAETGVGLMKADELLPEFTENDR